VIEPIQFNAEFFKALSHPLRIRILDELRFGEAGVNDPLQPAESRAKHLIPTACDICEIAVSSLGARKPRMSITPSRIGRFLTLLDVAKRIFNNHLVDATELLSQMSVPAGE